MVQVFAPPTLWVNDYGYGVSAGQWRTDRHLRFLTDVNGDGMADIVGLGEVGVYLSLSTGNGFSIYFKRVRIGHFQRAETLG